MSASGKYRNRLQKNRVMAMLSEAERSTARYVGPMGTQDEIPMEGWALGRVLTVIPSLCEDHPPELRDAIARRRDVHLKGACPCGGRRRFVVIGGSAVLNVAHSSTCPADNDLFVALLDRYVGRAS